MAEDAENNPVTASAQRIIGVLVDGDPPDRANPEWDSGGPEEQRYDEEFAQPVFALADGYRPLIVERERHRKGGIDDEEPQVTELGVLADVDLA